MKDLGVIIVKNKDEDISNITAIFEKKSDRICFSEVLNDYSKNAVIFSSEIKKLKSKYIMVINTSYKYNYQSVIDNFLNNYGKDVYYINHYAKQTAFIDESIIDRENIGKYSKHFIISIYNFIIKKELIKNSFSNDYNFEENIDMICHAINNVKKIFVINNLEKKIYNINNNLFCHIKEWYFNGLKLYKEILINSNSLFVKYGILRLLYNKYMININSLDNHALNEKDLPVFERYTKELLNEIDDEIINNYFNNILMFHLYHTLMKIKYSNKKIKLDYGVCEIEIIDHDKNNIYIDFKLPSLDRKNNKEDIFILYNGKKIKPIENKVYSKTKFFGKTYHEARTFKLVIKLNDLDCNNTISVNANKYMFPLVFVKPMSKINESLKNSHYIINNYLLKYNSKNIVINKINLLDKIINEIKFLFEILYNRKIKNKKFIYVKSFALRLLYWITKPFFKKEIWISYDKLYKGGDNGEYFFNYAYKRDKTRKIYYVINKTAIDYKRLKDNKNVLKYRSLRHYLNVLNAKTIFSTHANPYVYNGFASTIDPYFRDLLDFDVFCIQHGLSVNQIAKFQNRVYANTKLYFCASIFEINNLKDESYDYEDKQLLLTGIPRFDGLKDNHKKQILITPTWRQDVAIKADKLNEARGHNDNFKNTMYYKIYLSLITNKKLVETAKKYNYKIIYLLHPAIANQKKDFPEDIYTKVVPSIGDLSYETILRESSLMITDYSGVQFDFAYMKKPIVYYHPDELPPHYEEGGLKYEKEGFGPVIKKEDELVDYICKSIKNNCKNEKKYIDRVNNFFKYDDLNTCKRIYEEAVRYYNENE